MMMDRSGSGVRILQVYSYGVAVERLQTTGAVGCIGNVGEVVAELVVAVGVVPFDGGVLDGAVPLPGR